MFGNWVQKVNSKLTYVLVIGMLLTAGTLSANALLQTPGIDIGPNYTQQAEAGQNIVYSHILNNTGTTTDTFLLQVFSAHNWPVELIREVYPTGTLELPLNVGPQMTASFQVSLTVPPGIAGVTEVTIITATSQISPTVHKTATDTTIVLSRIFLPVIMNRWPPVPDTPVLNPISNPNGGGDYSVTWNTAYRANTYTLQEDDNTAFSSPTAQYSGAGISWSASSKTAGTYYYRVKASNSWGDSGWSNVQSATVQPPSTLFAVADASALEGIPNTNDGTDSTMWTGYEHCSDFSGITRSLVKFDLSAIPAGAQIAQASLSLFLDGSCDTGNNSRTVTTYRLTSDWGETAVTWNTKPGFAEAYGSSTVSSRVFQRYSVDVTNLARAWVNGTYPNYGLMLRSPESSNSARLAFGTRQAGSSYAPYITITYAGAGSSMDNTSTVEGIPDSECKPAIKDVFRIFSSPMDSGMFKVAEEPLCSPH